MAFAIHSSEPARRALRRLARKELGSARDQVLSHKPPSEEAIHAARKSVKKARAILRLIDAGGGRGLGRTARRLRDVNRTLSCLRDATAMIETLATLKTHHPDLFSEHGYARIRRRLEADKRDAVKDAGQHGAWRKTARELRKTLRRKSIDRTNAIMSMAPRQYVERVERAWHARRRAPRRRAA